MNSTNTLIYKRKRKLCPFSPKNASLSIVQMMGNNMQSEGILERHGIRVLKKSIHQLSSSKNSSLNDGDPRVKRFWHSFVRLLNNVLMRKSFTQHAKQNAEKEMQSG